MSLIKFQKCFIVVLVSKLESLHKKKEKNGMKKNATHTISIYGNCMIRIFLKIFFCVKKKSFEQSIQLLAKHLSVFWAATTENFDFFYFCFLKKNTSHTISNNGNCMTSIFLMATTKIFLSIFEITPKNFFVFFFQLQIDFRIQTNIF